MTTRKLCLTAMGTALFVVFTLCLQVPVFVAQGTFLCVLRCKPFNDSSYHLTKGGRGCAGCIKIGHYFQKKPTASAVGFFWQH